MINPQLLLSHLQALLKSLEADLLARSEAAEVPEVGAALRQEYAVAREAERTAENFEDWRSGAITQAAAAWVLSCVFVRFLEDNLLIDPPKIAGPGPRLQRARDEHELYFQAHPTQTDREYLLSVFDDLAQLPGTVDVFGPNNPLRQLPTWLSGDAAGELLRFFQRIEPNTGNLIHDFTDPEGNTRFLGDLYQDLSEAARKKYALLQTPQFVEEFILDRTLEPAVEEFGLDAKPEGFRMVDPACGSGHFLLGAFGRILRHWQTKEPGTKARVLVQRALDSVHGVDVNPFAVAIARFRLLLSAMSQEGITRLADAPGYQIHLAVGDSLYHSRAKQKMLGEDWTDEAHYFNTEDAPRLQKLLLPGTYHCVVANPPYITPKDRAANLAYRRLYPDTCHMKYSLAVPFLELLFRLAVEGGHTGQITANSFMKREFGKKLIESFLPRIDLTHVIDTSGAYIPGHGTPTVILLGRGRKPVSNTIRTVMGIRGEPSTPDDPAQGQVWSAIIAQLDHPGSESEFVSVGDTDRGLFHTHPWSIGGGGVSELKEVLEQNANKALKEVTSEIGIFGMTNADEVMFAPKDAFFRQCVEVSTFRRLVLGDQLRDWQFEDGDYSLFPYREEELIDIEELPGLMRWLWPSKTVLGNRATFSRLTYFQEGRPWWEWHQTTLQRLRTPLSITFPEIATHNHFVLDRGRKVFNRSAPIIKLPPEATEEDHLALLGLLNSSVACFWLKQVCHNKGSTVDQHGARQRTDPFEDFFAFNTTKLQPVPLPDSRPHVRACQLEVLATKLATGGPLAHLRPDKGCDGRGKVQEALTTAKTETTALHGQMIAQQEELDWECYHLYGLTDQDLTISEPPPLELGQRAFEIVLARKVARGETQTTWFARHGSTPITELPADWPEDYRRLVERRIEVIEKDKNLALIEQPEYKRRWNTEPWDSQLERALREWLLNRLEGYFDFDGRMGPAPDGEEAQGEGPADLAALRDISLYSVAQVADVARRDPQFMEVGEVYRDDPAFDVERLVGELVQAEQVPLLPVLRYKPPGLRKRAEWERTWELQRQEDAGQEVGKIPVPPKYKSSDFITTGGARYWALRGKLDVPKERWISLPHCEGQDGTLMLAWAGYNHLQQAKAISTHYVEVQEHLGGRDDPRLVPLLAAMIELLPWLKQWHNDLDPEFGVPMGDYFEGFVQEEARGLEMTVEEVKGWQPVKRAGGRRRKA